MNKGQGGVAIRDVRLRAHHLLCIQGFRGQGYSPQFVANLARLTHRLRTGSELSVRIVAGADDICFACPHLRTGSCNCPDQDVCSLDAEVMKKLDIDVGDTGTWASLLQVIGKKISPDDMNELCAGCRWNDLDYCSGGVEALKNARPQDAGAPEDPPPA
ncbi:MAG: DUF1284 domain-containing protein [Thermoleophilia bacterium]|nr:DUF1284 domain-containing protein [Thermoleophilia bacterium]